MQRFLLIGHQGDGVPQLVLVHGFGMSGALYEASVRRLLPAGWGAVLLDLPGHGHTHGVFNRPDVLVYLRAAAIELWEAGTRNCVVMGESLGCAYVTETAEAMERAGLAVDGAVLLAPPVAIDPATVARWIARTLMAEGLDAFRGGASLELPTRELVRDASLRARVVQSESFLGRARLSYLVQCGLALARLPWGLRRLRAPAFLLLGELDVLIRPWTLRLTAALCGARSVETWLVPDCGHALLWDPATPMVAGRIRQWLEDRRGSAD